METLSYTIRKFNRFELKYLITQEQAAQFRAALGAYLLPDEHSHDDGRYTLASLYYDSPDLRCYWEKVDGVKFRRKLRIRRYENGDPLTDETPVFVEIKQRVARVTQKRRVVLPYGQALRLCNDRQIPDHAPGERATVEEIYAFVWQYNLRPASIVRYARQAFVGTNYDIGLRVTFDTALTAQASPLHLHEPPAGVPMLGAHWVVMEIKVNERIPYWLSELVAAHNLQITHISKYCRSIEATGDAPRGSHVAAEWSQDVLASSYSVFHPAELVEIRR
ncbi:MAG: polyphosphate polymerase domain-containing protein [Thermoflexales bacterium]|nr:polyphosphate polymerase domain-containing protein [Thermoflexales bacterium]